MSRRNVPRQEEKSLKTSGTRDCFLLSVFTALQQEFGSLTETKQPQNLSGGWLVSEIHGHQIPEDVCHTSASLEVLLGAQESGGRSSWCSAVHAEGPRDSSRPESEKLVYELRCDEG